MKRKLKNNVSGNAVLLASVKLITTLLGLVVTRILSEQLSFHNYGTYSQVLLMVSTISSLTILGMIDGLNYFFMTCTNEEDRESYVATIFALQITLSAIVAGVALVMKTTLVNYFANPDISKLLVFALVLPLTFNIISLLQILLVAIGKARVLALRNIVVSVIRLVVIATVLKWSQNVTLILSATVLFDVVQIGLFIYVLLRNKCRIDLCRVSVKRVLPILKYCVPMAVFITVNAVNRDLDKYLISYMENPERLAVYANASKALPFDILAASFTTVLIPKITRLIANKNNAAASALYKAYLKICYISTGILCGAALVCAPQLMRLLYSEKYLSGLTVFCIYILVDAIRFTNSTLLLSAAGKTKRLMLLGGGALAINAVLNIGLYKAVGFSGPAVATLVITLLFGIILLSNSAKELGTGIKAFFDVKHLVLFLGESVIVALPLIWVRSLLVNAGMNYFVILVVTCGLYAAVMLALNWKEIFRSMKEINAE